MNWTLHRQQQQRGAQLPRQAGDAPTEAVADRAAQDHEQAGGAPQAGETELEEDQRGEDAEPVADAQGLEEAAHSDRND